MLLRSKQIVCREENCKTKQTGQSKELVNKVKTYTMAVTAQQFLSHILRLTSKVPQLYRDITFSHFSHIKSNLQPIDNLNLKVQGNRAQVILKMLAYQLKLHAKIQITHRGNHLFTVSTSLEIRSSHSFTATVSTTQHNQK